MTTSKSASKRAAEVEVADDDESRPLGEISGEKYGESIRMWEGAFLLRVLPSRSVCVCR